MRIFKNKLNFHYGYALLIALSAVIFFCTFLLFFIPLVSALFPLISNINFIFKIEISAENRILKIFIFTILQAFLSALLACITGTTAAFFCANRIFWGRKLLISLSSIPLCVPAVIIALSYILFFGNNGFLNSLLKKILQTDKSIFNFLYSFKGIIICQGFYNFPVAMKIISNAWNCFHQDEEYAALILGTGHFKIFRKIILPYLIIPVLMSLLLIFLFCFFSFVIVLLFGKIGSSTLETELYRSIKFYSDAKPASVFAALNLAVSVFIIIIYSKISYNLKINNSFSMDFSRKRKKIKGKAEIFIFIILCIFILLFLLLPLISIFGYSFYGAKYAYTQNKAFSLQAWKNVLTSAHFINSLFQTLKTGFFTVCISLINALFLAYINFIKVKIPFKNSIPYFPIAVSPIILGAGWNFIPHPDNIFILIFAQSSLLWPYAWVQIQNYFKRIPENMIEAAIVLCGNKKKVFFEIVIPLCKKGITCAAAFIFAMSAGDTSLPLILNISGFSNLSLLLFGYSNSYRFSESAVTASILIFLTAYVFFLQEEN